MILLISASEACRVVVYLLAESKNRFGFTVVILIANFEVYTLTLLKWKKQCLAYTLQSSSTVDNRPSCLVGNIVPQTLPVWMN